MNGLAATVELKAQVLRHMEAFTPSAGRSGFAIMPDGPPLSSDRRISGKGSWRQADVRRAINAAQKAGLTNYHVEIAPDGTISIVVGAAGDSPDRG